MDNITKALLLFDTIKLCHSYFTHPSLTPVDRITHALSILPCALQYLPTITCNYQLAAIA